jgi:hypothetical protein
MELFERAKREKCINLALLTAVLGLAATQADLDVATSVRHHPTPLSNHRCWPITCGCRGCRACRACGEQVMAIMKQNGWEPNERTYTSLLRVYSQVNDAIITTIPPPKSPIKLHCCG